MIHPLRLLIKTIREQQGEQEGKNERRERIEACYGSLLISQRDASAASSAKCTSKLNRPWTYERSTASIHYLTSQNGTDLSGTASIQYHAIEKGDKSNLAAAAFRVALLVCFQLSWCLGGCWSIYSKAICDFFTHFHFVWRLQHIYYVIMFQYSMIAVIHFNMVLWLLALLSYVAALRFLDWQNQ